MRDWTEGPLTFYLGSHKPEWLERTWAPLFIVESLAGLGLRLHGFGVKTAGLTRYAEHLVSADSMAWSLDARRSEPLPGHLHKTCANCMGYAHGDRADPALDARARRPRAAPASGGAMTPDSSD